MLSSLFGSKPSRERPDLAAWVAEVTPLLIVDGDGVGESFPGARVLRHETSGGPGLPFHFPDARRLPAKDGELRGVVLAEVLDKVIDVGAALDEARRVIAADGLVLLVQTVAPEDFEERAIWNAVAKMRDPRHASSPSARQFAALVSGGGMDVVREASWEETADPMATQRPEAAEQLATLLDAAVAREATSVVRDGKLVLARRAALLRRR